jgi:hypothetical protein
MIFYECMNLRDTFFLHSFIGPKKRGAVMGLGGEAGEKSFGALFGVCLKEDLTQVFRCPFGEVVRGMDVLERVAQAQTITRVYVADCGALIPLQ